MAVNLGPLFSCRLSASAIPAGRVAPGLGGPRPPILSLCWVQASGQQLCLLSAGTSQLLLHRANVRRVGGRCSVLCPQRAAEVQNQSKNCKRLSEGPQNGSQERSVQLPCITVCIKTQQHFSSGIALIQSCHQDEVYCKYIHFCGNCSECNGHL